MSRRELSKTLEDLLEKAEGVDFWFIVQGKDEPTATDQALMAWITERQVFFQVITSDKKAMSEIYKNADEVYEVKRLAPKVLSLMQEFGADEEAAMFGLFVNNDEEVEEDRWLNDVMASVVEEFKVYAMNDGLVELGLDEGEEGEEAEPEEEPEPPAKVKSATKKAAAKPPARDEDDEEGEEEEAEPDDGVYTREQLDAMDIGQLKEVAASKGITLPPRTRMPTYINAILGEDGTPEAEVEEVGEVALAGVSGNGDSADGIDYDGLATLIVDKLFERLASVAAQ
jgi:hypothetical protein